MKLEDTYIFKNTDIDVTQINVKDFPSNYTIEIEGELSEYIGIVLEGQVDVKAYSYAGKIFTINTLTSGMIFGDVLMFGRKSNVYPGNLITKGKTQVAIIPNIDIKTYLREDMNFLFNFLSVLSDKVHNINSKSKMLSQDSVRDKILFYLHKQIKQYKNNKVILNMTKEELAANLFVQRPSLSRELIKMREEGLIEFDRWSITLKAQ